MVPVLLAVTAAGSEPAVRGEPLVPAFAPRAGVYNYSPCLLLEPGGKTLHAWYCANRTPGDVTDYLCHRKATRSGAGWRWSEEQVALPPAPDRGSWDSRHVCDPEVVAGRFRFHGKEWRYALLYLGCDAESCTHNQVGVAFADSLDGPWSRYPNPIVRYTSDPAGGIVGEALGWPVYRYWGVGQPAALSLDRAGRVLLFYSRSEGEHGEEMVTLDLSDMDRGPKVADRRRVPAAGLQRAGGGAPTLANIGVALDEARGRCYMVREELPPGDGRFPGFIAAYSQVAWIPWNDLRAGRGTWTVLGDVDRARTGWPRNHNASLLKDAWGRLHRPDRLTVGISVAETYEQAPPDFAWLWTYRIGTLEWPVP